MRAIILLTSVLALPACDIIAAFYDVGAEADTISYTSKGSEVITVDGEEIVLKKFEGTDTEKGETFIILYQGNYKGRGFECVGTLEACEAKIRKLKAEPGDTKGD